MRPRLALRTLLIAGSLAAAGTALPARASESGVSFYLLGSGGPEVAIMPPVSGVFLTNTAYYYHGKAEGDRQFTLGGNVVAGLKGTIAADFPTVLWVPSTKVFSGTLALGGALPFGQPWVKVSTVLTGPRGRQISLSKGDTNFIVGDPVLVAALGWQSGRTHLQLSNMLNVPIGEYRKDELANLAFHRWANDVAGAVSWHDKESGWDLSAKAGFTFNGENHFTDYKTGTEWHLEGSIEKALNPQWSLGAQAYHFDQMSGDSGPGAVLGAFKGRVTGVGGQVGYNMKLGRIPISLRLHGVTEFGVQNRLEGHAIWFDLSMPLMVNLPPGAHP